MRKTTAWKSLKEKKIKLKWYYAVTEAWGWKHSCSLTYGYHLRLVCLSRLSRSLPMIHLHRNIHLGSNEAPCHSSSAQGTITLNRQPARWRDSCRTSRNNPSKLGRLRSTGAKALRISRFLDDFSILIGLPAAVLVHKSQTCPPGPIQDETQEANDAPISPKRSLCLLQSKSKRGEHVRWLQFKL